MLGGHKKTFVSDLSKTTNFYIAHYMTICYATFNAE